jgi:hypothetical protein
MFIAALATIAKKWRQIKCPLRDEWRNKMWCIHTKELRGNSDACLDKPWGHYAK